LPLAHAVFMPGAKAVKGERSIGQVPPSALQGLSYGASSGAAPVCHSLKH